MTDYAEFFLNCPLPDPPEDRVRWLAHHGEANHFNERINGLWWWSAPFAVGKRITGKWAAPYLFWVKYSDFGDWFDAR